MSSCIAAYLQRSRFYRSRTRRGRAGWCFLGVRLIHEERVCESFVFVCRRIIFCFLSDGRRDDIREKNSTEEEREKADMKTLSEPRADPMVSESWGARRNKSLCLVSVFLVDATYQFGFLSNVSDWFSVRVCLCMLRWCLVAFRSPCLSVRLSVVHACVVSVEWSVSRPPKI